MVVSTPNIYLYISSDKNIPEKAYTIVFIIESFASNDQHPTKYS